MMIKLEPISGRESASFRLPLRPVGGSRCRSEREGGSAMFGHASAAMTLDVYADEDDLDAVADTLNPPDTRKAPVSPGVSLVAPTGIDPVTFRFSVSLGHFRSILIDMISR